MKKLFITTYFVALSFGLSSCGQSKMVTKKKDTTSIEVSEKVPKKIDIAEAAVAKNLKFLSSDDLEGRATGSEGIEKAARYIQKIFEKNDINPFFESYRDTFPANDRIGYNIVGFKEGVDPELKDEFIIIGAHYDHIGYSAKQVRQDSLANGANDNASGTTTVLELAKFFKDIPTKRSIMFTLYAGEEMGLLGSAHLAKRLKKKNLNLYVMFNIEMVGVPMTDKDYQVYVTGYNLSNLAEKFNDYSGYKVMGFLPQAKEYNLFNRSDNATFYQEFHIPAQTISSFDFTNYDYYHHVSDEFQFMDIPFMVNLIEGIIPGIYKMANSPTQEIKMIE